MVALQPWIPLIALGIAIYGAYLQREQVRLMTPIAQSVNAIAIKPWWKAPTIWVLAGLAAFTWIPWVLTPTPPKPPLIGVVGWGGINLSQKTMPIAIAIGATDPKLKVMAIAFHYNGETDLTDVKELQKSALYDVRQGTEILMIKPSDDFISEVITKKMIGTNYMVLTVPSTVQENSFVTLRQALSMGAQVIWGGTGPP